MLDAVVYVKPRNRVARALLKTIQEVIGSYYNNIIMLSTIIFGFLQVCGIHVHVHNDNMKVYNYCNMIGQ